MRDALGLEMPDVLSEKTKDAIWQGELNVLASSKESLEWIRAKMPMIVCFSTDAAVRALIAGPLTPATKVIRVVVQGTQEVERLSHEMMKRTGLACSSQRIGIGSWMQTLDKRFRLC